MWHLDPVANLLGPLPLVDKNPLPNGNYRIRSFVGSYVLMTPEEDNGRPYVRKQVQNNNAQEVSCLTTLPFCLSKDSITDHLNSCFSGLCSPNRMACIQSGTLEPGYI